MPKKPRTTRPRSPKQYVSAIERIFAQLLLPDEILKQSPDALEEILDRHVRWAQGVLRRAGLPTDLRLHYLDGETWRPAAEWTPSKACPDLPPLKTALGIIGGKHLTSPEGLAAHTLFWAEQTGNKLAFANLPHAFGCFYQMTLFARFGLFAERLSGYATAGFRSIESKRLGGLGPRKRRQIEIRALYDEMKRRHPKYSPTSLEALAAKRVKLSRTTVRRDLAAK